MTTTHLPSRSSPLPRIAWWLGGGVIAFALASAVMVGHLTSERAHRARNAADEVPPGLAATPAAEPPAGAQPAASATVRKGAAPAAAPTPSPRPAVPPARMAQYRAEVETHVEQQRRRVISTCWPKEGLPRGHRSTTVTYNVTFNPAGREVARGIVQDRRAPAGKFGKCLGQLHEAPFSISPPGTYVTLRIPVTYP